MSDPPSTTSARPLLVLAHEATRTGSVTVLISLLRSTRGRLGVPVSVGLLATGPLERELRALDDQCSPHLRPRAVLVNSALGAEVLHSVDHDVPTAIYVHEQGNALDQLPPAARLALTSRADLVLAASPAVRDDLIALGTDGARIHLLPPVVDLDLPDGAAIRAAANRIGGERAKRTVVGCGTASWRKGTDLFVEVAAALCTDRNDVDFVWVGRRSTTFRRMLDLDCQAAGLTRTVHWIDEVSDARPFLSMADAIVLPSREDPQPLVALEAAVVGTPSVGFHVGGLAAMAQTGALVGASYPDVRGLADSVNALLDDPSLAASTLENAREWLATHHDPESLSEQFVGLVGELVHLSPASRTS